MKLEPFCTVATQGPVESWPQYSGYIIDSYHDTVIFVRFPVYKHD